MSIHHCYQATDEQGRPTGKVAVTKVLAWAGTAFLVVLWTLYLVHLGHGHEPILGLMDLGAISVVGTLLIAALYYAGRRLGEIGVQAAERRFGGDDSS